MGRTRAGDRCELGPAVGERLEAEYRYLIKAFDTAIADPTPEALEDLRQATDRLMRAAAAIRLAVESDEQRNR